MDAKRNGSTLRLTVAGLMVLPLLAACSNDGNIRRVGESRVGSGDLEVRSTVRPEGRRRVFTREGSGAGKRTFSFYEHLTANAEASSPPAVPEAKPEAAPAAKPEVKPEEEPEVPGPAAKPEAAPAADQPAPSPAEQARPIAEVLEEVVDSLQADEQPATEADAAPTALPARYTLQVSSHPDRRSAERETGRLAKMGVEPHIVVVNVPGKGQLYRVRVGKFHTMDEARDFQGSVKTGRGVSGFVTPL